MCDGVIQTDAAVRLTDKATIGLGELRIEHPKGTFAVTPASLVSLKAIGTIGTQRFVEPVVDQSGTISPVRRRTGYDPC